MTDHTQLRKLATEALHWVPICDDPDCSCREAWKNCADAANPQAVIELLDEIDRLRKDAPQAAPDMVEENDRAVGKKWREDSRLETWFPFTAEKLSALEVEVHKLRMHPPFGEVVAWRKWNNKWHEYDYADKLDVGSLVGWEPLSVALRAALDAPAQPVDCRGCKHFHHSGQFCLPMYLEPETNCTNGDKFKPLPTIQLYKVTK